jgi:3' terminal RNA ribose 2'-O-methyltransferase Hen1
VGEGRIAAVLLTLTTTIQPATDLGYLLHKNPARVQRFALAYGTAHVFYPEATAARCTAALLLEVDPVGLVRGRPGVAAAGFALGEYVNDRPYAANSFLSVAISRVLSSALAGSCPQRPELAQTAIPLAARLPVVPCRGGADLVRRLFAPLGYEVTVGRLALDERFPEWGESPYYAVELRGTVRLAALLGHLYVLVPVLDNDKHYWIGDAEVAKLLRHGEAWLGGHPERELIVGRYLKHQRRLADAALAQLIEADAAAAEAAEAAAAEAAEAAAAEAAAAGGADEEERLERGPALHEQRHAAVVAALRESGAARVLDLGCSTGKLLASLLREPALSEIVGLDVSHRALEIAAERLHLDRLPERQRQRIRLLHGSLTYRDARLAGYDAAAVVEVIEHLEEAHLAAFERVLFEFARPRTVIVTTPNVEYNVRFDGLAAGSFRHRDHRFEWTRREFGEWTARVAGRYGYRVRHLPVGPEDAALGAPTQMAVFSAAEAS